MIWLSLRTTAMWDEFPFINLDAFRNVLNRAAQGILVQMLLKSDDKPIMISDTLLRYPDCDRCG